MYIPKAFKESDRAILFEFIHAHNFATLVTNGEAGLIGSHIPFLLDTERGENGTLTAHLALANAQVQHIHEGHEALAIFSGAHAYITPTWYEPGSNVPTWNYTAVHAYGVPGLITDETRIHGLLRNLVNQHEAPRDPAWDMDGLPEEYMRKMMQAVICFEVEITRLEGKFKLSQNRPDADQANVAARLQESADPVEQETGELMQARHMPRL